MPTLISLLLSIPDVVWSGLIASALTLSGVLISNRSSTHRLRIQLQHDASEKSKERTANLRREVYLTTAEELTKANAHFASLPQSDLAKTNAAVGLQGFLAAAAKLQLVAEPHTALLMNGLVATYGELLLRVIARLMPLQKARIDISINDDMYNKAQAEVTRVLAEVAKFNEAAKVDDIVFGALQRALTSYREQAESYSAARSRAWDDFNHLNVEFVWQLLTDMQLVGEQQIPVLIEIRRDLGLTSDIEEFRKQMDANWKRMSRQIDMLLSSLRPDG
jgi:predicted translin family RNA/ssDNA-binding protein